MSLARYLSKITQLLNSSGQVLTGGIADSAVTIGKVDTSVSQLFGMRNRIINGAMVIDQRNAGASVTPTTGTYTVDRWRIYASQTSKLTAQQNAGSVTPPVGFVNYLGCTSSSAYSVLATDLFLLQQFVEGFNIADLGWGTANAKTVTLSFKVYSSLTGTFGGSFQNSAGDRCYPFIYTVSSANTWTTISVTIPGDTSGTWLTTNGKGIVLSFGLGVGSNASGTAGSWQTTNYYSATGATSVVGTSGATFYITGVQLEKGSVATPFEYRPYGTELALCQRYYEKWTTGGSAYVSFAPGWVASGVNINTVYAFKVTKRAAPTGTASTSWQGGSGTGDLTVTSVSFPASSQGVDVSRVDFNGTGGTTGFTIVRSANDVNAYIAFSSEL